ncbi:MAG: hypothetical protein JSU78_07110 [Deltaproteobacteria bacterium]|nr:MAG: hypothetical protein JSU78_07110 [Deltaproteobacteria bacterium]
MAKTLKCIFLISAGLSILIGLFFRPEHPHFWWERLPASDAIFGFLGCILLVVGSKVLGHHWLQKDEDYYSD